MTNVNIEATQIQALIDDGEPLEVLDDALSKIVDAFKPGAGDSVTLTITVTNDLESDEDEEEEESED